VEDGVYRILSFRDGGRERFCIGQWESSLVMRSVTRDRIGREWYKEAGVDDILPEGRKRCLTITSGADGTTVYLDGRPARSFPGFAPLARDKGLSLYPVLGTSPTGDQSWEGELFGLAFYDRALSPDEVSLSYRSWLEKGRPAFPQGQGPACLYLFDEHAGTVVHNRQGPSHQLLIPPVFRPPVKTILVPPWRDFQFNRAYLEDVLVNLAGFVPFGFFVSALLINVGPLTRRKALAATVLAGALLSLSIELAQVYLPTRDSQLSDVIDNTLGTVIGVMLFARFSRPDHH
jgi:hypothetical protein